jgi:hypothetical protein
MGIVSISETPRRRCSSEAATLGREGHEELERAAFAADPGETVVENLAPEVRLDLSLHEDRQPERSTFPAAAGSKVSRWTAAVP